jgi:hypothetical protein
MSRARTSTLIPSTFFLALLACSASVLEADPSDQADRGAETPPKAASEGGKELPVEATKFICRFETLLDDIEDVNGRELPVDREFYADLEKFQAFMKSERANEKTRAALAEIMRRSSKQLKETPKARKALRNLLSEFNAELPAALTQDQRLVLGLLKLLKQMSELPEERRPGITDPETKSPNACPARDATP